MPKARPMFAAACLTLWVLSAPAAAQDKPKEGPSAYESLDPARLSAVLRELQMWEVHDHLIDQLGRTGHATALAVKAQAFIDKALARATGPAQRAELLNQAGALLRKIIASTAEPADDKALMNHLELKLKLAALEGLTRAEPYGLRLAYLQGADDDRREVVRLTADASELLTELDGQTTDLLNAWGSDLKKLVTVVPPLRQLRARLLYQASWIYLYRGLALPDGTEKVDLLARALQAARKSGQAGQAPHRAQLIQGIALRELGRHRAAHEFFSALNTAGVPPGVRFQAMFEESRNLAEAGKTERALQAVEQFNKIGRHLLGESEQLQVEVHSAILRSHVYASQAAKEDDAGRKQALLAKAFQGLVESMRKHGQNASVRNTLFGIIARKYGGRVDPQKPASVKAADSVALLALSQQRLAQESPSPTVLSEVATMLREVMSRKDDPVAKMMQAETMWYLAVAYNGLRENTMAGRLFAGLARKFPDHPLAGQSAIFGVKSFAGIISDRMARNLGVPIGIRKEFVSALEALLGNAEWAKDPKVAERFYDLGWQYDALAGVSSGDEKLKLQRQAVEAYNKVPRSKFSEYMDARQQAMALEVQIMAAAKDVPFSKAADLVNRLNDYSARAREQARQASDKDLAKDLMTWGARAAFNVAVVNYKHMERRDKAIKMLRALPSQWPQADRQTLAEASEFLIRKLVEKGENLAAGEEVKKLIKEDPERGSQLIALVIRNTRREIERLAKDPRMAETLAAYRRGYLTFAKLLYDATLKAPDTTAQGLLDMKQLYGDALVETGETGDAKEALKLFLECKAEQDKQLKVQHDRIDEELNAKIRAMEKVAATGPEALHRAINRFLKEYPKAYGTEIQDSYRATALLRANNYLGTLLDRSATAAVTTGPTKPATTQATQPPAGGGARPEQAANMVMKAYKKLMSAERERRKDNLPQDANTFWGLAKSHFVLKEHYKALKYYSQLARQIRPGTPRYWAAQLAYCWCALETFRSERQELEKEPEKNGAKLTRNAEKLEELQAFMRQLEKEDPRKGGLYQEYNRIEAELRSLLK